MMPFFFFNFFTKILHQVHVVRRKNIPSQGPALLISNHVSLMDKVLIRSSFNRRVFFSSLKASSEVQNSLKEGKIVCLFPEGKVTDNGYFNPFHKEFEKLLKSLDKGIPVIPIFLSGLWGNVFSKALSSSAPLLKQSLWCLRIPIKILVGKIILSEKASLPILFQKVQELAASDEALTLRSTDTLGFHFLRNARRSFWRFSMADSTGRSLRFFQVLSGVVLMAKRLKKQIQSEEKNVGVLLPSCVPGALVNIALTLLGRVSVNLNFTVSKRVFETSCTQAEIQTIVTSKKFLKKLNLSMEYNQRILYLEDLFKNIGILEKIIALFQGAFWPKRILLKRLNEIPQCLQDPATIIFSSGSTGIPKGICLSHKNILANCQGIGQVFHTRSKDRLVGVLPFFHSFGYTGTIWFPLLQGFGVVYHTNPMDGKEIGCLVEKFKATLFLSTPTFYQMYTRSCSSAQFSSLRTCIAGAEKISDSVSNSFEETFGLPLLEGYGCTELSPVVSLNTPLAQRKGSVGRPLPNIAVRCVNSEDFSDLSVGEEGLLLVKGPNVMEGYLNDPEQTKKVFQKGWYVTGDRAFIDSEGFLHITGRLSRFSKIGGEMVPHLKVENALNEVLGGAFSLVVSVADEKKGESLAVLYTHETLNAKDLVNALRQLPDLPNLWCPKASHIFSVEKLPFLGSGKADLKEVQHLVQKKLKNQRQK